MPEAPLRIECYDMSHLQGTDYVGSMVVIEDGLPKRSDYRRFKVTAVAGQRRLRRHARGAHPAAPAPVRDAGRGRRPIGAEDAEAAAPRPAVRRRGAGRRRRASALPTRRSCSCSTAGRASSASAYACSRSWSSAARSQLPPLPSNSRRSSSPASPIRSASPVTARRSTSCSRLGTRRTASRSASTASSVAERMTRGALDGVAGLGPARRRRLVDRARRGAGGAGSLARRPAQRSPGCRTAVARAVYEHLHARRRRGVGRPDERRAMQIPLGASTPHWWRETFTNGADLEYELQILPLAAEHLAGLAGCSISGSGEGQLGAAARAGSPRTRIAVGLEPSAAQLASAAAPGRRTALRAGRGGAAPVPGRLVRRRRLLSRHRARDGPRRAPRRGGSSVWRLAGASCSSSTIRCSRDSGSGFVDDQILGEHYWRVGPYLREDVDVRGGRSGCATPFRPPAAVALRQPGHRPRLRADPPGGARAAAAAFLEGSVDLELESAIPRSCCSVSSACGASRWEDGSWCGGVPDPLGHVRSRALHGGGDVRGPGLVRHRQPAAGADRQGGRAHEPGRRRVRTGLPRGRPGRLRGYRRARPGDPELRSTGARVRVVFLDAPDDVLVRRYEGTRRRHPSRRTTSCRPSSRSAPCSGAARRGRRRRRHRRAERAPVARSPDRARRTGRLHRRRCRPRSCRSASSTGSRSTSISSSTAVSFPTRTGCPSCGRSPGSTRPYATTCSRTRRRSSC